MKQQPSYYAILPANVRYDNSLKPMEKIMFAEVTALANKDGFCSASNRYFAALYNVTEETVSRWISKLNAKGYLNVMITRNDLKQVIGRQIFILEPLDKKVNTPIDKKINTLLTKKSIPIDKKVKVNTTSNNNTSNNRERTRAKEFFPPTKEEVLEVFTKKLSTLDGIIGPDHWAKWETAKFFDYYETVKWKVGRAKMKDWKRAVSGWVNRGLESRTYLRTCPLDPNYTQNIKQPVPMKPLKIHRAAR